MALPALPENALSEVTKFMDLLFHSTQMGYVYIPTLDRSTNNWRQQFFLWPNNRSSAAQFIIDQSPSVDVFIGPALYKTDTDATKENVLGSFVSWVDIDGTYRPEGAPIKPSFAVQSSDKDHLHFYWRMDSWNTSVESIEDANFKLAYNLEADNSGWDSTQVLRPPCTYNHKRNRFASEVMVNGGAVKGNWSSFQSLPVPENARDSPLQNKHLNEIPPVDKVIAEHDWPSDFMNLFKKPEIEQGKRSGAIMAIAYHGAEMQLSNEEILALLLNADERWGKFRGRKDQIQRLLDSITRARAKYPFSSMPDENIIVRGFMSLLATEYSIDWAINELLDRQGIMIFSGQAGGGKTQFTMQLGMRLAMGEELCGLEHPQRLPLKTVFLSQEMSDRQIHHVGNIMVEGMELNEEQHRLVEENFLFPELKSPIYLDTDKGQSQVLEFIRKHRPAGIFLDSLGTMIQGDINDDLSIRKALGALSTITQQENCFFWFIHHNRKPQVNNKTPNALGDVYGSQYITSIASTVVSMWPTTKRMKDVRILKNRMGFIAENFVIEHGMDLVFRRESDTVKIKTKDEKVEAEAPKTNFKSEF